ncbi:MAG: hypothetical protein O7D32_07175 [bacterium]|nr:hypothetical protein [bacterium]
MKKALALGLALVTLVSFTPKAHSIGVFGSWWNSNDIDNGFGLGANHQIQIIPLVGADVRVSWINFDVDGGESVNMFPFEAAGYAKLGLFYAGLGIGYYVFDSDIDNSLGGFIFGGASVALADLGVFGELKYTFVETEISTLKVDASGIGLNLGVTLPFF